MEVNSITHETIRSLLKERKADSHKGDYGHALLVAGKAFCMGAAIIASRACLRSGVGLLTVNVPADERAILQTNTPEAMLMERLSTIQEISNYDSIGIGPGIGIDEKSQVLLSSILNNASLSLIIDADALTLLAREKKLFHKIPAQSILTPHPKEFDRLFGLHKSRESQIQTAIEKAKEYNVILVLKGHETIVTNGDLLLKNTTGNTGLAKGGSGDALTGLLTSLLAQKYEPWIAAQLGVYLHGLAADVAIQSQSQESLLITDVIECFGQAFNSIRECKVCPGGSNNF